MVVINFVKIIYLFVRQNTDTENVKVIIFR